jgi:DNA-binding MarR family transcriptional regulator
LRITQFAVLRILARLGPLPVTQLAQEVALDRSTMGRNLDPLERRGLVSLSRGQDDGRERLATLTPAGVAAIAEALPHWRRVQEQVAAVVPQAAIGRLAEQIRTLSQ